MRILFQGDVRVSYRQLYVQNSDPLPEGFPDGAWAGQQNGLCGAAYPGLLFLTTGLHTGNVGFTVESHDHTPPIDDSWEEIVEVSFTPRYGPVALVQWAGEAAWPLDLEPVSYRVRYCARGMDAANAADSRLRGTPIDHYLLQFWPQSIGPDRVVRQTSAHAAYWHRFAREQPPPLPPRSPLEIAERERQAELERQEAARAIEDRLTWGGRRPSERLLHVGGNVFGLAALDRDLVDAIAEDEPDVQRAIARWAARRAYDLAGLSSVAWIAPALAALERGEELPPPFDDQARVWQLLFTDPNVPQTAVSPPGGGPRNASQQAMAVPALWGAAGTDPLRAAIDALYAAAVSSGDEWPGLLDDVRRAFPASRRPH